MKAIFYLFSFFAISGSFAFASPEKMAIFCYHENQADDTLKYFPLLNEQKNPVILDGRFEFNSYLLPEDDYNDAVSLCRKQTGERRLNYNGIKGASPTGKALYDSFLGWLSTHYAVKNQDDDVTKIWIAHELYNRMQFPIRFSVDLDEDDPTQYLKKLEMQLPIVGQFPIKEFIKDLQFVNDFSRSELELYKDGQRLFSQYIGKGGNSIEQIATIFELIERALSGEMELRQTDVRISIAIALATRSQTFESNVSNFLNGSFNDANPEFVTLARNEGPMKSKITILGSKLILETDLTYMYEVPLGSSGSTPIGTLNAHRECEMDLVKGKLSKEKIEISRN